METVAGTTPTKHISIRTMTSAIICTTSEVRKLKHSYTLIKQSGDDTLIVITPLNTIYQEKLQRLKVEEHPSVNLLSNLNLSSRAGR